MFAGCGSQETTSTPSEESEVSVTEESTETVEAPEPEEEAVSVEEASVENSVPEEVIEEPAYFPLEETKSFTYWFVYPPMFDGYADGPQDYLVYTEAEERLNVNIEFDAVPIPSANEQFMLMIAGGDYADAILNFTGQYSGSLDDAIEQEIIIDLTDALDAYAPDYEAAQSKSETRLLSSYTDGGNQAVLYGFQTDEGRIPKFGAVIRKDWLDQLGLDVPVTVDDYHDVLLAFKNEIGCSAPYGLASDGVTTPGSMQGAYDIVVPQTSDSSGFYQVDGQVQYGPIQDSFKEMLTTLNQWYNEGIIDSNFVSDNMSASSGEVDSTKIASGSVGIWRGYATNLSNYEEEIGGDAEVIGISPMRLTEDSTLHFGFDSDNAASNMGVSISTDCEDVELVVRFFNYFFTEEGSLLANYGVEGYSFEYNDQGDPVYTDLITNNPEGMTMDVALCLYTGGSTSGPYEIDNSKNYYTYTEAQMAAGNAWLEGTDGAYQLPDSYTNLLSADEISELNSYYNDIVTTYNETVLQFITGTKSLDDFDSFRDQLIDMGIERCIELVQQGYDRYMQKAA
jgi:putative aldouronate transport system substrate-binding protein